jgi:hypothetical protein
LVKLLKSESRSSSSNSSFDGIFLSFLPKILLTGYSSSFFFFSVVLIGSLSAIGSTFSIGVLGYGSAGTILSGVEPAGGSKGVEAAPKFCSVTGFF